MSPAKRRKLSPPIDGSPAASPKVNRLSAVARFKALRSKSASPASVSSGNESSSFKGTSSPFNPLASTPLWESQESQINKLPFLSKHDSMILDGTDPNYVASGNSASTEQSSQSSPSQSRDQAPIETGDECILSTFKPSKQTIKKYQNGKIVVTLQPGERLVALGEYGLCVEKGRITIMGMSFKSDEKDRPQRTYKIHAPSYQALPVIRCPSDEIKEARISLQNEARGLEPLRPLSPLFDNLWNDRNSLLAHEHSNSFIEKGLPSRKINTYQIMFSSKDSLSRTSLQPLISPPEWNALIARCSAPLEQKPRSIFVCGPKSSGKSTFARLLMNKLISTPTENEYDDRPRQASGVFLFDLDPGQPEYSVPGQLALIHIREPNFGPPFSHPIPFGKSKVIRSHSISAVSPSSDPDHYMACIKNLFQYYTTVLKSKPNVPLVINTPGWVQGTGLEMLVEIIKRFQPTEVVYMSHDGPQEVVETLEKACKPTTFFTLPSQTGTSTRTAAQLRTMQYMSYFHLEPSRKSLSWHDECLTSLPPWEIKYSGENAGILGVMCYGEQPPAELLADTINGSLVSVVVIDDMAAIPGCKTDSKVDSLKALEATTADSDKSNGNSDFNPHSVSSLGFSNPPPQLEDPMIIRTPEELPYFNPINTTTLLPQYSYCIGLALIRGIDVARHRLQILTSIEEKVIDDINDSGKKIVLVSGKLDTPGWAYIESAVKMKASAKVQQEKKREKEVGDQVLGLDGDGDRDGDLELGESEGNVEVEAIERDDADAESGMKEEFEDMPWVERIEGDEGRGKGARVWRVRRDLGRGGNGGE